MLCDQKQIYQQKFEKATTSWLEFRSRIQKDQHSHAESIHCLAAIQMQNWYVLWRIMCALVQYWIQRQRVWQDYLSLMSWHHRNRISKISHVYSSNASQILDLQQFAAEEADRMSHCEENVHCCANPDKAQPPIDQRKKVIIEKATIEMQAAHLQRGPSVIPLEERMWPPIQTSPEYNHTLKPISKTVQTILRHELYCRVPDAAVHLPKMMQIMFDLLLNTRSWFFQAVGRFISCIRQGWIWILSWPTRRTSVH